MADTATTPSSPLRRWISPEDRPLIILPDGKVLQPRAQFAGETGQSERSVRRMNPPTTYISNVAYVDRNESLKLMGAGLKRRNQPPKRKHKVRRF